ncbi:MAG TPA: Holliday junction resolvase RuvX [Planctomycetaceae bacterium]|nr:Holliday junction resolvase RuvX [Planctomycetaceae bacterium]
MTHPPTHRALNETGRLAGIDYGTHRIGIAISDPDRILSSPLETYRRQTPEKDAAFFRRLVREERIVGFVVGLPLHLDDYVGDQAEVVIAFGNWLHETTDIPVDYQDERYTSVEAERLLRQGKLTHKKRRERRDRLAAQIILKEYLERHSPQT